MIKLWLFTLLGIIYSQEIIKLTQGASKTVEFRDAIDLIVYYSGQTQNDFKSVKKFTYQQTGWSEYPYFTPEVTVNAKIGMDGTNDKALVIIGQMNEESEGFYRFRVGNPSGKLEDHDYNVIILKPPSVMRLTKMIDYTTEHESSDIARCEAPDAKPAARVMWRSSHTELQQALNALEGQTFSILSLAPLRNYNGLEITCEIEHEALIQGADYDSRWETSKVITLDVRFAPSKPTITYNQPQCDGDIKGTVSLTCREGPLAANPPATSFQWLLPDGSKRNGNEITIPINLLAQDSVVSCQAINEVGMGEMERKTITALTGEACPSAASATMIIIIIVILLIIFGLIAVFILYRKNLLCFAEKDGKDGPYNSTDYNLADTANYGYGTGGKQAVDYHPNGYEEVPTAPMSKPPIDDSDDEDEGPLLSQSNTEYHKQRRSNSNLRHSPSRATPDKIVDNLDNSYATDYNPTIERGQNQPHYASLNKDKLGVKKSDQIPDERVVYAELKHSGAHHPQDAYV